MEPFVPFEKLSKKKKRAISTQKRGTWLMNPATRKVESKKIYHRKRTRKEEEDPFSGSFYFSRQSAEKVI